MSGSNTKRILLGLCSECGKRPPLPNRRKCAECTEKISKARKQAREYCKSNHICPICKKEKLFGDEKACLECQAKSYTYSVHRPKTKERLENHNTWAKSTYAKRKEQGICTRCGKHKALEGQSRCGICANKMLTQRQLKYSPRKRDMWVAKGLCYFCGAKTYNGTKVCKVHYTHLDVMRECEAVKINIEQIKKGQYN